ncbi:MAG TPA: DUF420 domain-containing protein [Aquifex aeolicus]|nr:DUF420 domain-containing protein [Aquifex aeolicus]
MYGFIQPINTKVEGSFERYRKIAPITAMVWIYVTVTGWMIYFFLHVTVTGWMIYFFLH